MHLWIGCHPLTDRCTLSFLPHVLILFCSDRYKTQSVFDRWWKLWISISSTLEFIWRRRAQWLGWFASLWKKQFLSFPNQVFGFFLELQPVKNLICNIGCARFSSVQCSMLHWYCGRRYSVRGPSLQYSKKKQDTVQYTTYFGCASLASNFDTQTSYGLPWNSLCSLRPTCSWVVFVCFLFLAANITRKYQKHSTIVPSSFSCTNPSSFRSLSDKEINTHGSQLFFSLHWFTGNNWCSIKHLKIDMQRILTEDSFDAAVVGASMMTQSMIPTDCVGAHGLALCWFGRWIVMLGYWRTTVETFPEMPISWFEWWNYGLKEWVWIYPPGMLILPVHAVYRRLFLLCIQTVVISVFVWPFSWMFVDLIGSICGRVVCMCVCVVSRER